MMADTLLSCVIKTVQLLISEYSIGKISYGQLNSFVKIKLEFIEGNLNRVKKQKVKDEAMKILAAYNEIFISHKNPCSECNTQ